MPIQCLIFDCDGVILDSVPVKTRAYARLAEPYGAPARDRLVMYHTVHGGVSRYKKFEWFFQEVLGRSITPEESAEWGRLFADYALDEVRSCRLIAGARDVLDAWRGRLPLCVCSGAPQEELRVILRERRLDDYFDGIRGSPPAKARLLAEIVAGTGLPPETVLMVGDAVTDRDAAEYAGTRFYGVGEQLKGGGFPWGRDLTGLNDWITENLDK
jgi:phosphoglycolate phosphatase-like HAD superfamily hydrolase